MASSFSTEYSEIVTHEAVNYSKWPRQSDYSHVDLNLRRLNSKVFFVKGQKSEI